jgi:hypothetical protein
MLLPARFALRTPAAAAGTASAAARTTSAAAATAARDLGPRLIYGDFTTVEIGVVQALNRCLRELIGLHFNKRETAGTTGHLIADNVDGIHWADRREQFFETALVSAERKVSYKQFASHFFSRPEWPFPASML